MKDRTNVNGLSCLLSLIAGEEEDPVKVLNISQMSTIRITRCDIAKEILNDSVLKRVFNYTLNGLEELSEDGNKSSITIAVMKC